MLDKAIEHGKEKRKPFYRTGKFDRTCRCHGGCPYCESNRFHSTRIREMKANDQLKEI